MNRAREATFGSTVLRWLALAAVAAVHGVQAEDNELRVFDGIRTNLDAEVVIGATGTNNTLLIVNGASVTNLSATVGLQPGANGNRVVVSGVASVWHNTGLLRVGNLGTENVVDVNNQGRLVSWAAQLGRPDVSTSNIISVTDGSSWTNFGQIIAVGAGNQLLVARGGRLDTHYCAVVADAAVVASDSLFNAQTLEIASRLVISDGAQAVCERAVYGFQGPVVLQGLAEVSGVGSAWRITGSLEMASRKGKLTVKSGGRLECRDALVRGDQLVAIEGAGSIWYVTRWLLMESYSATQQAPNNLALSGGLLAVTNESGDAVFALGDARVVLEGGQIQVDRWLATNAPSTLELRFGTVRFGEARWRHSGRTLVLGDESGVGALEIVGGYLTVNTNVVLLSNVVLTAQGVLPGEVTNRGMLRPGKPSLVVGQAGPPGCGLIFCNQGTVRCDVSGEREGLDYGVLVLNNRAVLGGRLEVGLGTGYRPAWTNQFAVMRWRTREGAFTNAPPGSRLTVGAGSFRVVYAADALVLTDYVEDLDGDRVDDLWAQSYFGHSPLSLAELAIDSDGDGSSNAAEYLAGTDPRDGGSVFGVRPVVADAVGVRLRFPAVLGRGYRVWYATALPDWAEAVDPAFAESGPGQLEWVDDGSQTGEAPGSAGARFYRLGVE